MVKPTPQQAKALQALQGQSDVLEFMEACLEDAKNRLVTQVELDTLRVLQGEARTYQHLLALTKPQPQQSGKR
jgi:hypothetical protein